MIQRILPLALRPASQEPGPGVQPQEAGLAGAPADKKATLILNGLRAVPRMAASDSCV